MRGEKQPTDKSERKPTDKEGEKQPTDKARRKTTK